MLSIRKRVGFSLFAVLLFFFLLEGLCSIFFVKPGAEDFIERRILEQGLTRHKPKDEIRIFFYGESTIHGDALYPRSTIDRWVKVYLDDLLKDGVKKIRVFNFGRLGCNSHFITRSFRDTLSYKPDLVVFYTAHNDFVQLDNRHTNFDPRPLRFGEKGYWIERARQLVKDSAFLSEVNRVHVRLKIERHKVRDARRPKGIDLPLIERKEKTYNPVNDAIDKDSRVFKTILRRWRQNVQEIVRLAAENGVETTFVGVVSNFKDYHPNESVHSAALGPEGLRRWDRHYAAAAGAFASENFAAAATEYARSVRVDPEYAMAYYRLGQCYEEMGLYHRAKKCYRLANDKDRVPLRAPSEVTQMYTALDGLRIPGVSVIATQKLFESHEPHGIVASDYMLDTMHPTVDGQALIALEIVKEMHAKEFFPDAWWQWDRFRSIEAMKERFDLDEDFQFELYLKKACYVGRFYDRAIDYSRKALEIRPDSIEAKRSLAWAHWRKGDSDRAGDIYEELTASAPLHMREVFESNPDIMRFLAGRARRRVPIIAV